MEPNPNFKKNIQANCRINIRTINSIVMYFNHNIKFLRKRRRRTQDDVAHALNMKRSTVSGYENGVAQPGMEAMVAFSDYYKIAIDTLIRVDLQSLSESLLRQVEDGYDVYVKGGKMRILASTVDSHNNDNIELVNQKASAGYTRGFADPEFIRVLPVFQLPFLSKNRKYRTFQINGDSMLPIPHGAWVTGEYTDNWLALKDGTPCIIVTLDDGIVFKLIENKLKKMKKLGLYSLNPVYEPYHIDAGDIREIWKFVHYISPEMPGPLPKEAELHKTVANLQEDIKRIKKALKEND